MGQYNTSFTISSSILILSGSITTPKNHTFLTFYLHFSSFMYKSFFAILFTTSSTTLWWSSSSSCYGTLNTNNFYFLLFYFILFYFFFFFWFYFSFSFSLFYFAGKTMKKACDKEVTWQITWCDVIGLEPGGRI